MKRSAEFQSTPVNNSGVEAVWYLTPGCPWHLKIKLVCR